MDERRKSIRTRSFLGADIRFNKVSSAIEGLIRNVSLDGARIVFPGPVRIPDVFDVEIKKQQRKVRARTMWRSGRDVGVTFVPADTQAAVIPLDLARRLQECERANAVLRERVAQLSKAD
jgi:hypothetical protein